MMDSGRNFPNPVNYPGRDRQQFYVSWNSHQSNMHNAFPKMLSSEQFVDVTLACDRGSIKCHRIVLSACSDYLERLLLEIPCTHPIIFLRDMRMWELQALVQFMYRGEVYVEQQQLAKLMQAADVLQIRGLSSQFIHKNNLNNNTHNDSNAPVTPSLPMQDTSSFKIEDTLANSGNNSNFLSCSTMATTSSGNSSSHTVALVPQNSNSSSNFVNMEHNESLQHLEEALSVCEETLTETPGMMKMEPDEQFTRQQDVKPYSISMVFTSNCNPTNPFPTIEGYQRQQKCLEKELKQASDMVTRGMTFQVASEKYNIPISTIRFYMTKKATHNDSNAPVTPSPPIQDTPSFEAEDTSANSCNNSNFLPCSTTATTSSGNSSSHTVTLVPQNSNSSSNFVNMKHNESLQHLEEAFSMCEETLTETPGIVKMKPDKQFTQQHGVKPYSISIVATNNCKPTSPFPAIEGYQKQQRYLEEELKQALDMVARGMTFQVASEKYNIPISTIRSYMVRKDTHNDSNAPVTPSPPMQNIPSFNAEDTSTNSGNNSNFPPCSAMAMTSSENSSSYTVTLVSQNSNSSSNSVSIKHNESLQHLEEDLSVCEETPTETPDIVKIKSDKQFTQQQTVKPCSISMVSINNCEPTGPLPIIKGYQRRQRRPEAELIQASDMVARGKTFQVASEKYDIPISTIRFYMAKKGILQKRKRGRRLEQFRNEPSTE